jgi:hypothetical protein
MSTIVSLPDQATAVMPRRNYLNDEHGLIGIIKESAFYTWSRSPFSF